MNTILDEGLRSMNIEDYRFKGKLAGKSWAHQQSLNRIEMVRRVLFLFALAIFYPVFMAFIFSDVPIDIAIIVERSILSTIMIICGLLLPKFRLTSLLVALLPVLVIIYTNFLYGFGIWQMGFNASILVFICIGIFYHFREISQRKELVQFIREGGENVVGV